jgi:hypothetical protein
MSYDLHSSIMEIDEDYIKFLLDDNAEAEETHVTSQGQRVYSKTLLPVDTDAPQRIDMKGTF